MNQKVVLASGNPGKLQEFQHLLSECGFDVLPQSDFDVPEAEETGLTFVENAIIKARNACERTGLPAIADDSGIEVDALNGRPGIYSARFSAGWQNQPASDAHNNAYLLHQLRDVAAENRSARYQCILVFMHHAADPTPVICEGSWEGQILETPLGDNGFGYDPLFFVTDQNCTSAQLPKDIKNRISHRAKAMAALLARLQNR